MQKLSIVLFTIILALVSCKKDEDTSLGKYSKGIFIVNEGAFQSGTGTITFRDATTNTLVQDVFGLENNGQALGNIAQSMIKMDNKYFIAINNGAKIQVVGADDFKLVGTIPSIETPRYFVANTNKLYLSAWGANFNSGKIYDINPADLSIKSTIDIGGSPEKMAIVGNQLYVTKSSIIENSRALIIIDTNTNKVAKSITIGDNPNAIAVDKNNDIWVICSGNYDYIDASKNTNGSLYRISNNVVAANYTLSNGANGLIVDAEGDRLYFLMDSKVFAHDIADASFENESIYDGYYYTIGYDKSSKNIFLTDPRDFQSTGETFTINPDYQSAGRFDCGIIPGYVYIAE